MNWLKPIGVVVFTVYSAQAAYSGEATDPIRAAQAAASTDPLCKQIEPFYWEIGDKSSRIIAARQGNGGPDATTPMPIASASKWIFGAYVVQKRHGQLTTADIDALTMRTGYTSLKYSRCIRLLTSRKNSETVGDCFASGKNNQFTEQNKGKFFYNGGHFQQYAAMDLNLNDKTNTSLTSEMQRELGIDFSFEFGSPQLAGGVITSANDYAKFLRAMLDHQLAIGPLLGSHSVCTNPSVCPTAVSTPIPKDQQWRYSLAHWVETDPNTGDGAFSSPGAFGFYPWIDASKTYYGIIARNVRGMKSYIHSVECGAQIRKAFMKVHP